MLYRLRDSSNLGVAVRKQARSGMQHRRAHLQKCPASGKVRFRDQREAVRALQSCDNARQRAAELGAESRRRECRTYCCDDCRGWHTTSQENRPRHLHFDAPRAIANNHVGFVGRRA